MITENILEIVSSIWQSVLGLEVAPADSPAGKINEPGALTACVQITGAWSGVVMASFSPALSVKVASIMLEQTEADVTPEDARDCLSEVVNMIGGNLKATLPSPCSLSLPWVTTGAADAVSFPHCKVVTAARLTSAESGLAITVMAADRDSRRDAQEPAS